MTVRLKRIYEPASGSDGQRILVDRLWPRGLSKEEADVDHWAKDVAPSDELRKWFGHDVARWDDFRTRYFAELDDNDEAVGALMKRLRKGDATFVFAAKDEQHNNAVALKEYVDARA